MAKEEKESYIAIINNSVVQLQEKDEDKELEDDHEPPLPLTVTSRVLYMLGDITAGPAFRFAQWLELVRKRSARYHRTSGFPHRHHRLDTIMSSPSWYPPPPPAHEPYDNYIINL